MDEPRSAAVLDPFEAYAEGELELRRRLTVLSSTHLVSIVVNHRMTSLTRPSLECIPAATLVEVIILAVTRGAARRD
jgi:predicted transcriptional regulator